MNRSLVASLAVALVACADAAGDTAASSQAIVGGQLDSGDPAVVALLDASNVEHCTGTLVAKRAILTAGHCAGGGLVTAAFGASASASRRVAIQRALRHPMFTAAGAGYDVALLFLSSDVTDIAPVPIAETPLTASAVGTIVRHVGFGDTTESSTGATSGRGPKQTVSYPITIVQPLLIWSGAPGEQTCNGDSGGPALVTTGGVEEIVAVVSDGPNCHDPGNDARVDVPDIRAWIAMNAPLPPPVRDASADHAAPDAALADAAHADAANAASNEAGAPPIAETPPIAGDAGGCSVVYSGARRGNVDGARDSRVNMLFIAVAALFVLRRRPRAALTREAA